MPLVPAFSIANNIGNPQSQFVLTDTSTGSDVAITNRLLYLYQSDNSLLGGAPIQFPLSAGSSITLNVLTQDIAYAATLNWVSSTGAVLYHVDLQIGVFTGFLEWFYYGLCQLVAAQANIVNDRNFFFYWSMMRNTIDAANNSITTAGSIYNAEAMLLQGQFIVANQNNDF